jgi:hypothetical protein
MREKGGHQMAIQYFALTMGIVYVLAGILGFVPAALSPVSPSAPDLMLTQGYGYLLGLFPVNVVHNMVHIGIGLWGIAAYMGYARPQFFAKGLTWLYGILTIMGLAPGLNTIFGLAPLFGHDVWLHAATAIAAAYFGWAAQARMQYRRAA